MCHGGGSTWRHDQEPRDIAADEKREIILVACSKCMIEAELTKPQ